MASQAQIIQGLKQLDVNNPSHWTSDGLPMVQTVRLFAGDGSITREAITAAVPGFSRATPTVPQAQALQASQEPEKGAQDVLASAQDTGTAPSVVSTVPFGASGGGDDGNADDDGGDDDGTGAQQSEGQRTAGGSDEPAGRAAEAQQDAGDDRTADAVQRASEHLEQLRKWRTEFDAEYARATAAYDEAVKAHEKVTSKTDTLQSHISAYHARQKQLLEQRAKRIAAVNNAGFDLKAFLQTASPLDNSMKRKNQRGVQRPAVPRK